MRIFIFIGLLTPLPALSQPYIDIVNFRYLHSPKSIESYSGRSLSLQYFNFSTNLPITNPERKVMMLASPYADRWTLPMEGQKDLQLQSFALPVTTIFSLNEKWNLSTTIIVRNNSSNTDKKDWQLGGAVITGRKKSDALTYRFGLYMNSEFFGIFIVPLAGIHWKINRNTQVFGLLPGNLVFEKKAGNKTYYGAGFRSMTNSYGHHEMYYRIDENQLGLYIDQHLTKNIVLNLEAGHSLFRKIRTGTRYQKGERLDVQNSIYLKAAIAYRMRFQH